MNGVAETVSDLNRIPNREMMRLGFLMLVGFFVKILLSLLYVKRMWIWRDEQFYFSTAYDLLRFSDHTERIPGFLNYPPLTSILISPVFLFDLSYTTRYHLSLLILNLVFFSAIICAYLILFEVFGKTSLILPAFLIFASPSYMTLCLMSEIIFIAAYVWQFYFFIRYLKTNAISPAIYSGVFMTLMILTRKTGSAYLMVIAVIFLIDFVACQKKGQDSRRWCLHLLSLSVAVVGAKLWDVIQAHYFGVAYGGHGLLGYLQQGFLPALQSPGKFAAFLSKFIANLTYVNFTTFGFAVVLCVWLFVKFRRNEGFYFSIGYPLLSVFFFAMIASFAAATQMYIFLESSEPKYMMYGRYMEYFSIPIFVFAFGALRFRSRDLREDIDKVVFFGVGLVVLGLLSVPAEFFTNTVEKAKITSSNMGIGWMFVLGDESANATICFSFLVFALVFIALWFAFKGGQTRNAYLFSGLVALIIISNYYVSLSEIGWKTRAVRDTFGKCAQFIEENSEQFDSGIYLSYSGFDDRLRFRQDVAMSMILAENLENVRVVSDAQAAEIPDILGIVPVIAPVRYEGYPVVFEDSDHKLFIYGGRRSSRPPETVSRESDTD